MAHSTIAILILLAALIMYVIPRIPLSVTTILAMLAMALTGVISFAEAYSGFASTAVMLVAGMMIIGQACFTSGLAGRMGRLLFRFVGTDEKKLVIMILLISGGLAVFLNGSLVVALLMPIIDSIAVQSKGAITRKHTYFPLGFASVIGNNLTTISATSMITAAGLLRAAGYGELSLFAPTLINLPAFLVVIVIYILFGYRLQQRWFDFEDIPIPASACLDREEEPPRWKMVFTGAVLVGVVIALVGGMDYGAAALLGAALLILAGCISERMAFQSVSWNTIIIVAGAIGFSKGLDISGAGELIANFIIRACGPIGRSPFGLCVIMLLVGTLISNVMSDNASVAIAVPIAIVLSEALGCDPVPFVLSTAAGVKVAVATPISVAPMTQVQVAGYRFQDYLRAGGLVNLVAVLVTILMIKLVYFL